MNMEGLITKFDSGKAEVRKRAKIFSVLFLAVAVLGLSFVFDSVDRVRADSGTAVSSVTVGNSAPTLSGVLLQESNNTTPIILVESTTQATIVKAIITDTNGDADITSATATIYRTSVANAEACTANNANCYVITSGNCTLEATDGNNDRNVTCTANLQYFADRTDDDTETWTGFISATDGEAFGTGTDTEEVNTLQALNTGASVSYGTLSVSATTSVANDVLLQVTTTGNEAIDVTVQAANDMCNNATCVSANEVRACQQQYSTNTATEYEDTGDSFAEAIELSSTTARNFNLESVTPTQAAYLDHNNTDDVFWKIGIPTGAASAVFNGTTTITSKANSNTSDDVNETLCN
jgi:hypothetical protein